MRIVVFCDSECKIRNVANIILTSVNNHVSCKVKHDTVIEIPEKDMVIDIRPADILKAAGLRPDYVLFYFVPHNFIEQWEYNVGGRYTEINNMSDLIQMIISDKDKPKCPISKEEYEQAKENLKQIPTWQMVCQERIMKLVELLAEEKKQYDSYNSNMAANNRIVMTYELYQEKGLVSENADKEM